MLYFSCQLCTVGVLTCFFFFLGYHSCCTMLRRLENKNWILALHVTSVSVLFVFFLTEPLHNPCWFLLTRRANVKCSPQEVQKSSRAIRSRATACTLNSSKKRMTSASVTSLHACCWNPSISGRLLAHVNVKQKSKRLPVFFFFFFFFFPVFQDEVDQGQPGVNSEESNIHTFAKEGQELLSVLLRSTTA